MFLVGIKSTREEIDDALAWGRQWQSRFVPGKFNETEDAILQREALLASMEEFFERDDGDSDDDGGGKAHGKTKGKGKSKGKGDGKGKGKAKGEEPSLVEM